jgi:hypothetical protein
MLNEPRYLASPIRPTPRCWAPRLPTARTLAETVVVWGLSVFDLAGDEVRSGSLGNGGLGLTTWNVAP